MKNYKPDIIHFHSSKAGYVGRLASLSLDCQKYYTPHGYSFLNKGESKIKRFLYKTAEMLLSNTHVVTIACGKAEFSEAIKISKVVLCIENGINTDRIDTLLRNNNLTEHQFTVYTAGRIGSQKNPEMFNEIACQMPDIQFVWVGGGEVDFLIADNITVTGYVSRDDVIRLADAYEVYLSCSLYEGLPIALKEAMYMGKTCIFTDIEGNNELIDSSCGMLFNSSAEGVECIQKAIDENMTCFQENARKK